MRQPEKLAVIDVGSNTCRLVIYECLGSGMLPYFNEKAMAGLGRNLSETGRIHPEGWVLALETLRRYRAILSGLEVTKIIAVATAAVRVAQDGSAFHSDAEEALGVPLIILSGDDEGRLSSLGVRFGLVAKDGIVADMGGSSMELKGIGETYSDMEGETYLLGPLAHPSNEDLSVDKRRRRIRDMLKQSRLLAQLDDRPLFVVGGAWRAVAAVQMSQLKYPLRVFNGYQMLESDMEQTIEILDRAQKSKSVRDDVLKVAKRRYPTLLHAALVLQQLIKATEDKRVILSSYGLRDGAIAEAVNADVDKAAIDTTAIYQRLSGPSLSFSEETTAFVQPLFEQYRMPIVEAAAYMIDAGARMHPDHRAQLVFDHVLRAPIPKLTHRDRLIAAYALACRNSYKFKMSPKLAALLADRDALFARQLGTAMRLAAVFSGRSGPILKHAHLSLTADSLCLEIGLSHRNMVSETVRRRLKQLSGLFGRDPKMLLEGDALEVE